MASEAAEEEEEREGEGGIERMERAKITCEIIVKLARLAPSFLARLS